MSLKNEFYSSFQRDKFTPLDINMATEKPVTSAWKKNNFIAWYCVLWMVNVLE